jgi:hypothetical protein
MPIDTLAVINATLPVQAYWPAPRCCAQDYGSVCGLAHSPHPLRLSARWRRLKPRIAAIVGGIFASGVLAATDLTDHAAIVGSLIQRRACGDRAYRCCGTAGIIFATGEPQDVYDIVAKKASRMSPTKSAAGVHCAKTTPHIDLSIH